MWGVCLTGTIVSALPALAVAGWLAARAFPLRPRLAGALYGVGAGLMADAGWRLFCHFSHPAHVFGAHTLGIVVTGMLGVLLASCWFGRGRSAEFKPSEKTEGTGSTRRNGANGDARRAR